MRQLRQAVQRMSIRSREDQAGVVGRTPQECAVSHQSDRGGSQSIVHHVEVVGAGPLPPPNRHVEPHVEHSNIANRCFTPAVFADSHSTFDGSAESSSPNDSEHESNYLVSEAGMVLPSGWQELGRRFHLHYTADLSFIHLPTLMFSMSCSSGRSAMRHDLDHPTNHSQSSPDTSLQLLLPFLALTFRHCGSNFRDYLAPGVQDWNTSGELSAHFASLAIRHLAAPNHEGLGSTLHAVQGRLMMSSYEWSVGRCLGARRLLREAISMAQDLGIDHEHRARPGPPPVSVAMAFEAELMGVRVKRAASQDNLSSNGSDQEIARRTFWSCYLLDIQFSLGEHRSKLLQNTENSPLLPSTEDCFMRYSMPFTSFDESQQSLQSENMLREPTHDYRRMSTGSHGLMPTPLDRMAADARSLSTSPSPGHSVTQGDNIFGHYVRSLHLLSRVNLWTHVQRQRYVL